MTAAAIPAIMACSVLAALLQPSGPGSGLPGHQGSDLCMGCHPVQYQQWARSLHARTVHPPSESEQRLLSRSLLCGDQDAKLVLGEKHARRFMVDSEKEPGRHVLLPCRYDVGPAAWTHLHETDWMTLTWEKGCGACHTTGFSSDDLTFREMKVGCESCHGPAVRHGAPGAHGSYETRGGMISFKTLQAKDEVTICASCHLQGGASRKTGLGYAYNFVPGDDLLADYAFDWGSLGKEPEKTGNPIDIHQKLVIRDLIGPREAAAGKEADLKCSSCHSFHEMRHEKHEKLAKQEFCHVCHEKADFKVKEYNQACNVCEF